MSLSPEMERAIAWYAEHDDQSMDRGRGAVRRQQAHAALPRLPEANRGGTPAARPAWR